MEPRRDRDDAGSGGNAGTTGDNAGNKAHSPSYPSYPSQRSYPPQSSHSYTSYGPDGPMLPRWLTQQAQSGATGPWDLYQSRHFADLWYGARAAAERVRGLALEHLYTNRPHPGGLHPDPREPGAFSSSAVISAAAPLLGLRTSPDFPVRMMRGSQGGSGGGSDPVANVSGDASGRQQMGDRMRGAEVEDGDAEIDTDIGIDEETGQQLPYAWIAMFPAEAMAPGQRPAPQQQQRRPRPPMIVVRSMHADQRLMEFEIACLLGYWHHEHDRLVDPDSPGGTILLPRDPGVITLLHQYAIALLCLARDCPVEWKCHCNAIRARFNAPPPDHELPTGQFTLAELERETERHRRNSEPRFPYRDNNAWTE